MKISDFLLFLPPSFLIFISLDISRSVNETKKDLTHRRQWPILE